MRLLFDRGQDLATVIIDRRERRTCREQGAAIGPVNQILGFGFRLTCRIRQRKDNRSINLTRHLLNDRLGKSAADSGQTNENRRVDVRDYISKFDSILRLRGELHTVHRKRLTFARSAMPTCGWNTSM